MGDEKLQRFNRQAEEQGVPAAELLESLAQMQRGEGILERLAEGPARCRGCQQVFPGSRDTMAVNGQIEHIACYDPSWDAPSESEC